MTGKGAKVAIASKDPNNARQSLLALFAAEPQYTRAVCHLILVDYICLPMYPLPPECQFLNATRAAAEAAVRAGRPVPHKMI
jgi:hypothetical protein